MSKTHEPGPHRHQREARTISAQLHGEQKARIAAFDVVPLSNGKPVWSTSREDLKVWQHVATPAKAKGLEWAGDWQGHLHELAHFQLPNTDQIMRQA